MLIKGSKKFFTVCLAMLFSATIASSDFLIDDFDDGNGESELNSYWYFYTMQAMVEHQLLMVWLRTSISKDRTKEKRAQMALKWSSN
jgi:hypothetical protein